MYKVIIEPSIFRTVDVFELGQWKWKWLAYLHAWLYVENNPHAKAYIREARDD